MIMKKYVLGMPYSQSGEDILMINKLRPDWQAGKVNGIGGKVEDGESPEDAIIREFLEEGGIKTKYKDWNLFCKMIFENDIMGGGAIVFCYKMFDNCIYDYRKMEEEKPEIFNVKSLLCKDNLMQNIPLLINLSLSEFSNADLIKF